MRKRIIVIVVSIFVLVFNIEAIAGGKGILIKGGLDRIKGEQSITIEFTYDNMRVGKFPIERDYVDKKVSEYNEKEAGRGDKWKESWIGDRKRRFQPAFIELFNKKSPIKVEEQVESRFKLIVNTKRTEPGFNVGVWRENAQVDFDIVLMDVKDNVELARISIYRCPGRDVFGYDFDTGLRIEEAYAKGGKELAKLFIDELEKGK